MIIFLIGIPKSTIQICSYIYKLFVRIKKYTIKHKYPIIYAIRVHHATLLDRNYIQPTTNRHTKIFVLNGKVRLNGIVPHETIHKLLMSMNLSDGVNLKKTMMIMCAELFNTDCEEDIAYVPFLITDANERVPHLKSTTDQYKLIGESKLLSETSTSPEKLERSIGIGKVKGEIFGRQLASNDLILHNSKPTSSALGTEEWAPKMGIGREKPIVKTMLIGGSMSNKELQDMKNKLPLAKQLVARNTFLYKNFNYLLETDIRNSGRKDAHTVSSIMSDKDKELCNLSQQKLHKFIEYTNNFYIYNDDTHNQIVRAYQFNGTFLLMRFSDPQSMGIEYERLRNYRTFETFKMDAEGLIETPHNLLGKEEHIFL